MVRPGGMEPWLSPTGERAVANAAPTIMPPRAPLPRLPPIPGALRGLRAVFDALRGYLSEGERLTVARSGGGGVPVSRAAAGAGGRKKVS
jgi:hypothetical protein